MARATAKDLRRQQRSAEILDRALARGELDKAIAALADLPDELRRRNLPRIVPLFGKTVLRAQREEKWGELGALAALPWPELLAAPEVSWALFWGCVRCNDWSRATRIWQTLEPAVGVLSEALAAAVAACVAGSGIAPPPLLARALSTFGVDGVTGGWPAHSVQSKREIERPDKPSEAEGAVMAAYAGLPWRRFADTVARWGRTVGADVASALLLTATRVAVWEQLKRQRDGNGDDKGPLRLAARSIRQLGGPEDLAQESLLAYRLAAGAFVTAGTADPQAAIECASALALYPDRRLLVEALALGLAVGPSARPALLELIELLVASAPGAPLWIKGIWLWTQTFENRPLPQWLLSAVAAVVNDPVGLLAALDALPADERTAILDAIEGGLPTDMLDAFVSALWPHADPPRRDCLADMIDTLIDRLEGNVVAHEAEREVLRRLQLGSDRIGDAEDLFYEIVEELIEDRRSKGRLSAKAMDVWRRLGEPALAHSKELLELGLHLACDKAETLAQVDRYIDCGQHPARCVEAMEIAASAGFEPAMFHALERLTLALLPEPKALLDLLCRLVQTDSPRPVFETVARGVLAGDDAAGGVLSARERTWVEDLLGLKGKTGRKKASPKSGAGKAAKPAPAGGKAGPARGQGKQLRLLEVPDA